MSPLTAYQAAGRYAVRPSLLLASRSSLASRAKMGGALRDDLVGDQTSAARAVFLLPGLMIGLEVIVVLAQFAAQATIAAERRAAILDARREHRDNALV